MTNKPLFDPTEIEKTISVLIEFDQVFEIRILEPQRHGQRFTPRIISGYFNSFSHVVAALTRLQLHSAKGIYLTLNPVNPSLLARCQNKFHEGKDGAATADKDIICRRWLLIDADPKRPSGISASDEEKEKSRHKMREVFSHLRTKGWPEPIVADSGNGYHLLYRIESSIDNQCIKECLTSLDVQFSDDGVSIDTTVYNPSRIVKLYGTIAAKGDHCPELNRPHRMSMILNVPEKLDIVSSDLLKEITGADFGKAHLPSRDVTKQTQNCSAWDQSKIESFIQAHLIHCNPGQAIPYDGGLKWVLNICPFNSDHTNRSAVIVLKSDGKLGFRCQHDSCTGNNWKTLRNLFEPKQTPSPQTRPPATNQNPDLDEQYGPFIIYGKNDAPVDFNQMHVAAQYAHDHLVLHEPMLNLFYDYDPNTGLWQTMTEAKLAVEIGHTLRNMLRQHGANKLLKKRSENLLRQVRQLLKGLIEKPDIFYNQRATIHVGNGVLHLDLDPPTLNAFSHEYYSRNRSEIAHDENAECPRFLGELLAPALDDDDIALLQKYAGQCLLGYNPSQKFLLLRGTPGGGKSSLVNVLESIIGTHNVSQLRVQHLAERFEIAGFVGKTLLCGKDVPGNFLNSKSAYVLKALVGGDRLDAEQKNVKHRFEVLGEFNVIITSNSRLHLKLDSDSGAWRRRLLIVDYERPVTSKPIPHFDRLLVETEGPGILNWCIAGACDLLEELRTTGKFQITPIQEQRIEALLCESDSVRYFVSECVVARRDSNVTVHELQTAYHNFCEEQGWQAVTVRQFENQITNIMLEIHRTTKRTDITRNKKNQRGFMHVALKGGASS